MQPETERFWQDWLATAVDPASVQAWLYGAFRLGDTENAADDGALRVQRRLQTAVCCLAWELQARFQPLPRVGSLRVLENSRGQPVCILRTTEVATRAYRDVDARFAYDCGEWDRSLKTWRRQTWQRCTRQCEALDREPDLTMPLVCERFRVIHPE